MVPTAKPEEAPAISSSVDFFGDTPAEAREKAQAAGLTQRSPIVVDPSLEGRDDYSSAPLDRQKTSLDRQRTNDLEEVKNIMRRESTRGRRRAHQHVSRGTPIQEVPTPPYQSSAGQTGTSASQQQSNQNASYFDGAQPMTSGPLPPVVHVSSPSASSIPHLAPLNTQTQTTGRFRSDSNAQTPTNYEGVVPGNAFSYQQSQQSTSPPRRPVPGMSQMKGALTQSQSGPGPSTQR